jgi:hypothetical protein
LREKFSGQNGINRAIFKETQNQSKPRKTLIFYRFEGYEQV